MADFHFCATVSASGVNEKACLPSVLASRSAKFATVLFNTFKDVVTENNRKFDESVKCPIYQRYYLLIVQYVSEFNAEKLAKLLRSYIAEKYDIKLTKKQIHFRVAKKEVAYEMTGFSFNSIGPYLMKSKDLLIIFPSKLYEIYPQYFYLGGGELELKVGVSIDDFMRLFGKQTLVIDISPDNK